MKEFVNCNFLAVEGAFWREQESYMQQNQIVNDTVTVVVNTIMLGSRPGTVIVTAPMVAHRRETAGMRINITHTRSVADARWMGEGAVGTRSPSSLYNLFHFHTVLSK